MLIMNAHYSSVNKLMTGAHGPFDALFVIGSFFPPDPPPPPTLDVDDKTKTIVSALTSLIKVNFFVIIHTLSFMNGQTFMSMHLLCIDSNR